MKDISGKPDSLRSAIAVATLKTTPDTLERVRCGAVPKGDVLASARIAGIQAAKRTPDWLPFCHTLPLDHAEVEGKLATKGIEFQATVSTVWKTGVEMEALSAATAAALTAYDMLKPLDKALAIEGVRLLEKRGGKSQLRLSGEGVTGAILVVSDGVAAKQRDDTAGAHIRRSMEQLGMTVSAFEVVPDERRRIAEIVKAWVDRRIQIILTTGGTGPGPRDVTPEALADLIERPLPGVAEAIRGYGQRRTPFAMMSRSIAGVAARSFIVTLPGSRRAVAESLEVLFPSLLHVLPVLEGQGH